MKSIKLLLRDALDVMEDLNIKVETITDIKWNGRLKAVWGRCYHDPKTNSYRIELNPILGHDKVSWEDALNTVIHEVLHCHKDRFCHTGEWKRCANLVNRNYPIYHIERETSAEEKGVAELIRKNIIYKYEIRCSACGAVNRYQKESKIIKALKYNPNSCRCGCGSTKLHLIKL